jgi:thymidylate synthase (FAD)
MNDITTEADTGMLAGKEESSNMISQIITQLNPDVPPTGSDLGIVNAARKSFGRRSEWDFDSSQQLGVPTLKDKDKRLLEFLARGMTASDFDEFTTEIVTVGHNMWKLLDGGGDPGEYGYARESLLEKLWEWRNTPTHDTPFNHGFFSFEVKAPIFVARHLVKHEYLIMSEYSRRYITDDVEFYKPDVWRKAAADVKQGSSAEGYTLREMYGWDTYDKDMYSVPLQQYKSLLGKGVAPEQARMVLPQSLMTSWTWSGTLGAFANMCKLRLSSDTQAETRVVAQAVYEELKKQFPISAPLLVEGVLS